MNPSHFILRVSCGSDYSNLKPVKVNNELEPTLVDSNLFSGLVSVRYQNYQGLNGNLNPHSSYFKGKHRRYSIAVQGRFKHDVNADDIVFGVDSDTPVRIPSIMNVAIKILKTLDPSVELDISSKTPYVYSPLLCAINSMAVFPLDSIEIRNHPNQSGKLLVDKLPDSPAIIHETPSIDIGEWSFHSRMVPENVNALLHDERNPKEVDDSWFGVLKSSNDLSTYDKRKRYFAGM